MKDSRSPVDFRTPAAELLLNPRLSDVERTRLERLFEAVKPLPAHVYLATSGSLGAPKLVALGKQALLASAEAVVEHLASGTRDRWMLALPSFHVGGLGIWARSFLASSPVAEFGRDWDPRRFGAALAAERSTLTALVPTQVYDLVHAEVSPPAALRAVVVGGARLSEALYRQGRALGWPLLPSYGMTETASQVATAGLESLLSGESVYPALKLLRHVRARLSDDGCFEFKSASLLSGYVTEDEQKRATFVDPRDRDGFFRSEDRGSLAKSAFKTLLQVEGRSGDFVKIKGELVSLPRLEEILAGLWPAVFALIAVEHAREGARLVLVAESAPDEGVLARYAQLVRPFERLDEVRVRPLPRLVSGKLDRSALHLLATQT